MVLKHNSNKSVKIILQYAKRNIHLIYTLLTNSLIPIVFIIIQAEILPIVIANSSCAVNISMFSSLNFLTWNVYGVTNRQVNGDTYDTCTVTLEQKKIILSYSVCMFLDSLKVCFILLFLVQCHYKPGCVRNLFLTHNSTFILFFLFSSKLVLDKGTCF